jgi:ribosomal protein S18 acetylase RimI-like enzyme
MSEISLRPLTLADVPAVLDLQAQCYAYEFLESADSFSAKIAATEAQQTSWVAQDAASQQPLAYLVALPACAATLPTLNAAQLQVPEQPELLYLHDLAVAPQGRALGLGRRLVEMVEKRAAALGLRRLGLVAVQGSQPYWQGRGFEALERLPAQLAAKLASFGPEARFMQRALG